VLSEKQTWHFFSERRKFLFWGGAKPVSVSKVFRGPVVFAKAASLGVAPVFRQGKNKTITELLLNFELEVPKATDNHN